MLEPGVKCTVHRRLRSARRNIVTCQITPADRGWVSCCMLKQHIQRTFKLRRRERPMAVTAKEHHKSPLKVTLVWHDRIPTRGDRSNGFSFRNGLIADTLDEHFQLTLLSMPRLRA